MHTFALGVMTADIIDIRWMDCAHKGVLPQTAVEGFNGAGGSIYRLVDTISCRSPTYADLCDGP